MNKGLLFILVGVLFVPGSTNAVRITLEDVKAAIRHAFDLYIQLLEGNKSPEDIHRTEWEVTLEDDSTMTADCTIDEKKSLMNCGIGNLYRLNKSDLQELGDWFTNAESTVLGGSGTIRQPVEKESGVFKANAFYRGSRNGYSFNFHIPIDMDNKLRTFLKMLQKMLQARARMQ